MQAGVDFILFCITFLIIKLYIAFYLYAHS